MTGHGINKTFYKELPRFSPHNDALVMKEIKVFYSNNLKKNCVVLDCASSIVSLHFCQVWF